MGIEALPAPINPKLQLSANKENNLEIDDRKAKSELALLQLCAVVSNIFTARRYASATKSGST